MRRRCKRRDRSYGFIVRCSNLSVVKYHVALISHTLLNALGVSVDARHSGAGMDLYTGMLLYCACHFKFAKCQVYGRAMKRSWNTYIFAGCLEENSTEGNRFITFRGSCRLIQIRPIPRLCGFAGEENLQIFELNRIGEILFKKSPSYVASKAPLGVFKRFRTRSSWLRLEIFWRVAVLIEFVCIQVADCRDWLCFRRIAFNYPVCSCIVNTSNLPI